MKPERNCAPSFRQPEQLQPEQLSRAEQLPGRCTPGADPPARAEAADPARVRRAALNGTLIAMTEYRGECLCGAVRYVIEAGEPAGMYLCHCSRCRKETGTIHGANVFFPVGELRFERGEANLTAYALAGTRKARLFCTTCGSPMPRETPEGRLILPAGSLDDSTLVRPTAHIHCDSASAWDAAATTAPRYEKLPPG